MIFEIHGAGFHNKGAELMLRTTISELRGRIPGIELAIDPYYATPERRSELGLRPIFPRRKHVGSRFYKSRLFIQRLYANNRSFRILHRSLGSTFMPDDAVLISELSGLIDISGFAYSDQWGVRPTRDLACLTHYFKSYEKTVVLLPQAFGPFASAGIKAEFTKALENANLVCARDSRSYDYIISLTDCPDRVMKAPDITLFFENDNRFVELSDYICIIPNSRMLDQGRAVWGDTYLTFLTKMIEQAVSRKIKVHIVVHDSSGEDRKLAETVIDRTESSDVSINDENDSLKLKKLIGESRFVIGSRYHGLVSALSMGVPVIVLGWSHKYELLLEDFCLSRFLVNYDASLTQITEQISELSDNKSNKNLRRQIKRCRSNMMSTNELMWDRVVSEVTGIRRTP